MKNKTIFTLLEYFLSVLLILSFMALGYYIPDGLLQNCPDMTDAIFIGNLVIIAFLGALVFLVTVVLHEFGHLIFGLKAGMIFDEFSVANLSFKKIDNKVKFIVKPTVTGVGGYCKMYLAKDKIYDPKLLIWHLLGGVLMNFLLAIIFCILFFLSSNFLLTCTALIGIIFNLYLGLLNSLPQTSAVGMEYDMKKIAQTKEDEQYLVKLYTASTVSEELLRGVPVENIHLDCPATFKLPGDIMLGLVYTDILMRKNKFKDAKQILTQIESENINTLSKQNDILLKIQFIECELRSDCDINRLTKYWTKNVQQYIAAVSSLHPLFICFDYAYNLLIKKDSHIAEKKRKTFEKNLKKYSETDIKHCRDFFAVIDSKSNT